MNSALLRWSRIGFRSARILLLLALVGLPSCLVNRTRSGPGPVPGGPPPASRSAGAQDGLPPELQTLRRTLAPGVSREDRPVEAVVLGHGPAATLVVAGLHGDERAGPELAERFERAVLARPEWLEGRTLIIVPRANPDGIARGSRYNAAGVDLEADFRAGGFGDRRRGGPGPTAEPETLALAGLIETWTPARVLALGLPVGGLSGQGEGAGALVEVLGRHAGVPLRETAVRPGTLGTWVAEERRTPFVALDLPTGVRDQEALWLRHGSLLVAALTYPDPPPPAAQVLTAGR